MRVIGAGLPRTGTRSLQLALSRLLQGECYHMFELFRHLEHVPTWRGALRGRATDWRSFLAGYVAAVDWPASAFWRELHEEFPDALVVLSIRSDSATWWSSVDAINNAAMPEQPTDELREWQELRTELLQQFTPDWNDRERVIAAYERHNDDVRAAVPDGRLLVFRPEDGWEPLCGALGVPVPTEPYPQVNSREEFLTTAIRAARLARLARARRMRTPRHAFDETRGPVRQ